MLDLKNYLLDKDVYIKDEYFKDGKKFIDIEKQIDLIINFQKILKGYTPKDKGCIRSEFGKRIDRIYVMTKKLEVIYKDKNIYEKEIIKKCNLGLKKIKEIDYREILKRGMLNNEFAIDRVDPANLRVNNKIEVGKIKKITFNTVEEDFINYMMKRKKVEKKNIIDDYVKQYVEKSNLEESSLNYINIILDIPQESLRYLYKFRGEENVDYSEFKSIAENELEF